MPSLNPFQLFAVNREQDNSKILSLIGGGMTPPEPQPEGFQLPQNAVAQPQQPQPGMAVFQPQPFQLPAGPGNVPSDQDISQWPAIQAGIFKGESGGDYDALFGFSNRPGGKFAGTKLTNMTVDEALAFADPKGAYASSVRDQIGRTATPMGAYQVVGSTLKAAKDALGLKGDERMTVAMQDKIGKWIYENQGTKAWSGYKGPADPTQITRSTSEGETGSDVPVDTSDLEKNLPDMSPKAQRRRRIGMALSGLGVGLGQMSHGQAVNISKVLDDYLDRQDEMRQRVSEIMMEKRRRVERKEDIGLHIGEREDQQAATAALQQQTQTFQTAMQNTLLGHEDTAREDTQAHDLETQGLQFGHEDTMFGKKAELDRQLQAGQISAVGYQNALDRLQQTSLQASDFAGRGILQDKAESHEDTQLATRIAAEKENLKATFGHEDDALAVKLAHEGIENSLDREAAVRAQQAGFDFTGGQNDEDRAQRANLQRSQNAFDATQSSEQRKLVTTEGALDRGSTWELERWKARKVANLAAAKAAKQQNINNDVADVYAQAGDMDAANIARAGDGAGASKLFLQNTGDTKTNDIANFKYMQGLDPAEQVRFGVTMGQSAGEQSPGLKTAYALEEKRLTPEAEAMPQLEQQRQLLSQATQMLSSPDFQSGTVEAKTTMLRSITKDLGLGFGDNVTDDQVFRALAEKSAGMMRIPGTGTDTEQDADRYRNSTIKLGNTRDANLANAYAIDRSIQMRQSKLSAEVAYLASGGKPGDVQSRDKYINSQLKADGFDNGLQSKIIMELPEGGKVSDLVAKGLQPNQPFYMKGDLHFFDDEGNLR